MILKAVIMFLALVAGTSTMPEMNDVNISVSADDVATVVWDYLCQLKHDANGTVEQRAELTQKLKNLFHENILERSHDKLFPDEMEKELVPFAIDLYKCLIKESEKRKDETEKEMEDLQMEIEPHFQQAKRKIEDNACFLQEHLELYSNVLNGSVERMKFLNAQVVKCINDLENGLSDNSENLQDLVSSMPNKIRKNITMTLLKLQAILMAVKQEVKKTIGQSMKELSHSLAPFVKDMDKLNHQLEGLSFQLKKETLKLVANFSAKIYKLWKLLDPLPEAMLRVNVDEMEKSLDNLNKLVKEQVKIFQCKVSSYIEPFDKVMGQKVEEFGQKLGPHAVYMDDHMIFLEKELKDKVKALFKDIQNRKAGNLPISNPSGVGTELSPLEQNSVSLG